MQFQDFQPYYRNSYALVIGINEYQYVGPLNYAKNDAESVASLLVSQLNFPREQVAIIKEKDATKEVILQAYLDYVATAESQDDRILFFFAGHGLTISGYQGEVGYLVPADGDPAKPATLIRWDDLTRNADLIPAKHILFILDACFSGLALKRAAYPGVQRFLSEMLQRRSRQVITAGKANEVVADGGGLEGQNSIFTGYLIEGLRGEASSESGILTANGLMHYVYNKLAHDPKSQQTPHYGHIDGDGDFVFIAPTNNLQTFPERDLMVETQPEMPDVQQPTASNASRPNLSFANNNGYLNPSHPSFGRNMYSDKLGILNFDNGRTQERTFSWLGLVVEPVIENNLEINISQQAKKFTDFRATGNLPFERFSLPKQKMTTINSVVLFDELEYQSNYWGRYFRIEKSGNLEMCDSIHSYFSYRDMRAFRYVQTIGITWQFIYFAKFVLEEIGYRGAARFLVNLIGTKDTILADFSQQPGKGDQRWVEPGKTGYLYDGSGLLKLKCPDNNLQMQYNLILGNLNEQSSLEVIKDVAEKLGLAYNHQSEPRCFNFETDVFPWQQFFSKQS